MLGPKCGHHSSHAWAFIYLRPGALGQIRHQCTSLSYIAEYVYQICVCGQDDQRYTIAYLKVNLAFEFLLLLTHHNNFFQSFFILVHDILTLLPTGRGFLARTIRLAARTLEPFHVESPKFLTSLLCLLDTLWRNFRQFDLPGGLLQSFLEQDVMKNKGYEHFA